MHHDYLDRYAHLRSPIHDLDPRAKIVAVLFFIALVISVPRYEVFTLIPYAVYPVLLLTIADVPLRFVLKRALIVSPFILSLAVFAPVFDRTPIGELYGMPVTGGMVTCVNLVLKFFITILATLLLTSTTRFDTLLQGLGALGMPRIMVIQLSFLYRYLFLLVEEACQMKRARDARNFHRASWRRRLRAVTGVIAVLFVKTLERAERVYTAMAARGFDGRIRSLASLRLQWADAAFVAGSVGAVGFLRFTGLG